MSIHNYIQYHRNDCFKYRGLARHYSRVSDNGRYIKLDVKTRKGRWKPIFKENIGYTLNESQYWLDCA